MLPRSDCAKAFYWRVEFIQPTLPGDDRNVMLHGIEGEIVGPMTWQLAEAWMDWFDTRPEGPSSAVRDNRRNLRS